MQSKVTSLLYFLSLSLFSLSRPFSSFPLSIRSSSFPIVNLSHHVGVDPFVDPLWSRLGVFPQ
jgi:hypothetical protein